MLLSHPSDFSIERNKRNCCPVISELVWSACEKCPINIKRDPLGFRERIIVPTVEVLNPKRPIPESTFRIMGESDAVDCTHCN